MKSREQESKLGDLCVCGGGGGKGGGEGDRKGLLKLG